MMSWRASSARPYLEGCDAAVSDADVPALLDVFPAPNGQLGGLTSLGLARCSRLTDKGVAALAAHPRAADLESLSFAGCTPGQGLTLVHFSAQLERFLWDRVGVACRGCFWDV
jgi:hypothetical protein